MSEEPQEEPRIRIAISPEPTEEETAAVVAVVTVLLAASDGAQQEQPVKDVDRWALAGRLEALRGPLWPGD